MVDSENLTLDIGIVKIHLQSQFYDCTKLR